MRYINKMTNHDEEINVHKEIDFNKHGKHVNNPKEKIFAKVVVSDDNNFFFIDTYQNEIFDPIGLNANRKNINTKLKKVSKDTFDFYLIYLQTNNSIYLTRANRRFINE